MRVVVGHHAQPAEHGALTQLATGGRFVPCAIGVIDLYDGKQVAEELGVKDSLARLPLDRQSARRVMAPCALLTTAACDV